jgi:hypothetical protein
MMIESWPRMDTRVGALALELSDMMDKWAHGSSDGAREKVGVGGKVNGTMTLRVWTGRACGYEHVNPSPPESPKISNAPLPTSEPTLCTHHQLAVFFNLSYHHLHSINSTLTHSQSYAAGT